MERKELLKGLEIALRWEEDFILKYNDEPTREFIKASLPPDKYKKVMKLFNENLSDTDRHHRILKELIGKLRESKHE